jgi:tetratricopeptide (TPR) repeat protein
MHCFRRYAASRTIVLAGALALVSALAPTGAFAEDAAPSAGEPNAPVLVPADPTPAPAHQAATDGIQSNPCFNGKGSIKEVLDACAAFIASGSKNSDLIVAAHGNRALGLSATRDFDGAVAEMDEALRLDPKEPNLYFMRAAAYRAKKDFDKAIADIDEAIQLDAVRGDYYMLRGMIFSDQGDLDKAIAELDQKVKLDPKSSKGYSSRANLFRQKKDYDKAAADYTEVIKIDPDLAKGYVDRGVVKSRKGKPTDGSADISLAIKLEPDVIDRIKKLGVE